MNKTPESVIRPGHLIVMPRLTYFIRSAHYMSPNKSLDLCSENNFGPKGIPEFKIDFEIVCWNTYFIFYLVQCNKIPYISLQWVYWVFARWFKIASELFEPNASNISRSISPNHLWKNSVKNYLVRYLWWVSVRFSSQKCEKNGQPINRFHPFLWVILPMRNPSNLLTTEFWHICNIMRLVTWSECIACDYPCYQRTLLQAWLSTLRSFQWYFVRSSLLFP